MKDLGRTGFSIALVLSLGVSGVAPCFAAGAEPLAKRQIISGARQAYYNLSTLGFMGFQASATPNWRLVLKPQFASDPASAKAALNLLSGIHFTVTLSPQGVAKVTHSGGTAPFDPKVAAGYNQIYSGMEQAMSGFFETWTPFMLGSPFPDPRSDYQLEQLKNQYVLSYTEQNAAITTTMSKNLVITDSKVETSDFKSDLRPQFAPGSHGLLLVGYDTTYVSPSGAGNSQLKVKVDYQELSGFELPRKLNLDGSFEGRPFSMEMTFGNYRVKKRS